jgi:hypothetical protein
MNVDFEDNEKFLSLLHTAIAEETRGYDDSSPVISKCCLVIVYALGFMTFLFVFFVTLMEFLESIAHRAIATSLIMCIVSMIVAVIISAWRCD